MKKIFLLFLLLIPINAYSIDYIETIDNNTIHITDNYKVNDNEILIVDDRKNLNNIQIVNSYKIKDKNLQIKIIDTILKYNKKYPNNNWIRTSNSMYMEWQMHNFIYNIGLLKKHTISVDFGIKEEFFYKLLFFIYKL